jgi:hypothetical protein
MQFLVVKTFMSVRSKFNPEWRKGCFEILGFDFMIDADLTVWLIEVNTNPCLEESSGLLKILLPRMLDDAFKLTLDRQFGKQSKSSFGHLSEIGKKRRELSELAPNQKMSAYPVEGYHALANLWEKVYDIQSGKAYLRRQDRKLRSPHIVYVSETHDFFISTTDSYKQYKDAFSAGLSKISLSQHSKNHTSSKDSFSFSQ